MNEAILAIYALCNIKVAGIDKDKKIDCINFYANCLIVEDGRFAAEKVESCKKQYKNALKAEK